MITSTEDLLVTSKLEHFPAKYCPFNRGMECGDWCALYRGMCPLNDIAAAIYEAVINASKRN